MSSQEQNDRHIIWSDISLDLDDWRESLEELYPGYSDDELYDIMVKSNAENLYDERVNLNIQLSQPIIVIGDLGRWNGRVSGYKMIDSGNIKDCLYSDTDYTEWYVDKYGDLRADAVHHDGTNHYLSEPEAAGADGSDSRQMVADEENLSEGTSQNPVLQSSDERDSEQPLGGGSAESERTGGNSREADGGESRADGADESGRYDEMGSPDEQHQELGTGNREESGNIRLEYYDRNHEDKSLPFFGGDDTIREILGATPHLSASKEEIKDFYERNTDNATRTEYIKGIFNNDYTQLTLSDGRLVGYKTFQNVLHLWKGEYENRTAQSFYDWGVIAQHFEAMRLLGELTDTMKPLPSMDGQLTLIMGNQAEEQKTSAFTFSQEIIDAVLTRGSGVSEGKMRIYEQFEKSLSAKENADFLKNEYGWGGSYPVIIGAGIDEQHDGKGITISKGIGSDKPHITLSWSQVEKRIGDLIRMDRYLNPKEKEKYPEWLEMQEERRAELAEQRKNREILSTAPPEPENKEDELETQYEYHLGDSVYIGASQYEILSFDENRVMLYAPF